LAQRDSMSRNSGGAAFAAAAASTTPRTNSGRSAARLRATHWPKAWPSTTAGSPPSASITAATSAAKSCSVRRSIQPTLAPMPRGCGRSTRRPAAANDAAMASKSSESRDDEGSSTSKGPSPSAITSIRASPAGTTLRVRCAVIYVPPCFDARRA
jgi:hypothetical protein